MNETVCWYCNKKFEYNGEKYRDVNCPHCRAQNSIYNPAEIQPIEEEEGMINYQDEKYQGKYLYLPRVGETLVIEIKEIREAKSDNPKFNFTENVPVMIDGEQVIDDDGELVFKKKDLGYHVEAELINGKILSVTSMAAFLQVFKKFQINDGDKVKIFHKDKGIWEVEKLNG